jgi:hypothetical protein
VNLDLKKGLIKEAGNMMNLDRFICSGFASMKRNIKIKMKLVATLNLVCFDFGICKENRQIGVWNEFPCMARNIIFVIFGKILDNDTRIFPINSGQNCMEQNPS